MNIHEYQAKDILRKYHVPCSSGIVILNKKDISDLFAKFDANLYVVKAQIHAGGRGKAGGVKVTRAKEEAISYSNQMFGMRLVTHQTGSEGQIVKRVYVESGCDIEHEYYFSAVLDRTNCAITFMASKDGGVDIEEVAAHSPEKILKVVVDPATGIMPFHCRKIAFFLGFSGTEQKQMMDIVKSVYDAMIGTDAMQLEINPLVRTNEGKILALDAKINFDDNALFRHPEIVALRDEDEEDALELLASKSELSYVRMEGDIGCMVNGAGLAMATMDIIKSCGGEPANFLDVGGGATKEKVATAFKIILSDSAVKGILVNIFGGIMRCDVIAEGIIAAAKEVGIKVPLVVRLAGTNFEKGKEILANSGIKIIAADDLGDAAQKIVQAIKS